MINKVEIRQRLERALIKGENPATALEGVSPEWQQRVSSRIESALADFSNPPSLGNSGRRMNNFCIGSDPEFVFVRPGRSSKIAAAELGLKPALAAGCDQNQRLAELRGWPTVSVVEHVAGIMASLRWMYRLYPATRDFQWRAGAYYDGDGIGGHVHFGRKRPSRKEEIAGLDGVTKVFRAVNCFSNKDWDLRIMGDSRSQRYGDYGDFRLQVHGYEYRTHPSWLCSPMKAFFVLTTSKLAIYDPDLVAAWYGRTFTPAQGLEALQRLAMYYAGRDDDAWILKHLLADPSRIRRHVETWNRPYPDFKEYWGFRSAEPTEPRSQILAACVRPDETETAEVAEHLIRGIPLTYREVAPTFRQEIPPDYRWLYQNNLARGLQNGGAGDLTHNLVTSRAHSLAVNVNSTGQHIVAYDVWSLWTAEEQKKAKELYPSLHVSSDYTNFVQIDRAETGVEGIRKSKAFLRSGLFPLWTIDEVQAGSYETWLTARTQALKKEKEMKKKAAALGKRPLERKL